MKQDITTPNVTTPAKTGLDKPTLSTDKNDNSLQRVGDEIKEAASAITNKVGANLKDVDFGEIKDRAVDGLKEYTGRVSGFLAERPLASMAIAAAAGFSLAWFVRGRD